MDGPYMYLYFLIRCQQIRFDIDFNIYIYVKHLFWFGLVAKLCPTLVDHMDYSLPGSSVHGILKARTLEWVAISFSRGSF